jgi:hypothetical protein
VAAPNSGSISLCWTDNLGHKTDKFYVSACMPSTEKNIHVHYVNGHRHDDWRIAPYNGESIRSGGVCDWRVAPSLSRRLLLGRDDDPFQNSILSETVDILNPTAVIRFHQFD